MSKNTVLESLGKAENVVLPGKLKVHLLVPRYYQTWS